MNGTSLRAIATQFKISKDSVSRHQLKCVTTAIAKAAETKGLALRERLLDEVESIHGLTLDILKQAREGVTVLDKDGNSVTLSDFPVALRAIAEARKNVALIARMTGKLQPAIQDERGSGTLITWEQFLVIHQSRRQFTP